MKKLKYSPAARAKLHAIRHDINVKFGRTTAQKVILRMTASIRRLQTFENSGESVRNIIDIPCDYRVMFTEHNYIFYRLTGDTVYIVDIYNEREDFMWKLFGIDNSDPDSEDYWRE
ncbi:MAG: type II toxin-antitoxin system RelE/ParE family toxin [Clostridiales bacterium]|nr:type II toxin-antitoxin system RelE/ParE family toxin [Clostridiales bacterium]